MKEKLSKRREGLRTLVQQAPEGSGVYLMYDERKVVLYVGKAKNIRKRLQSYLRRTKDKKTTILMKHVTDIHHVRTSTEYEALLLENTLIKKHRPHFNIELKDGKSYPVIRITKEAFPRVFKTRRIVHDGSEYYGPFTSVHFLDKYLELVKSLYPLRRCRKMRPRKSPCLYFHIQRCAAPCAKKITDEAYRQRVEEIRNLLLGKTDALMRSLKEKMAKATAALKFEEAAECRDAIQSIIAIQSQQNIIDFDEQASDYVGYVKEDGIMVFVILQMRVGQMLGTHVYRVEESPGTAAEQLSSFIMQHYQSLKGIPSRIFIQHPVDDQSDIEAFLRQRRRSKTQLYVPHNTSHAKLMNMTIDNAWSEFRSHQLKTSTKEGLRSLQEQLQLAQRPLHIEGFDIAHIGGKHTVASMVYFGNGTPNTSKYLRYRIKGLKEGQIDDFASVYEVMIRRYTRVKNEKLPVPDLILIDGGKGQVSSATKALAVLDLSIPLVGLAKRNEELFLPQREEALVLDKKDPGLRMLQHVRDEAHRFATTFRAGLQQKDLQFSFLVAVNGIGPARAKKIMKAYENMSQILKVPARILAKTVGIPERIATQVQTRIGKLLNADAEDDQDARQR